MPIPARGLDGVGEPGMRSHDFDKSLSKSHAAEDLPFWEEVYRKAFPTFAAMISHRQDGYWQRLGVDRSVILQSSKQIKIDEKVRFRNANGQIYDDILVEIWSDERRKVPGWGQKELQADYIAYAIAPLGRCYLLPVIQLQKAVKERWDLWHQIGRHVPAYNRSGDREWVTKSLALPVAEVFSAIGSCLRIGFSPFDELAQGVA